jgi:hypothetical protein
MMNLDDYLTYTDSEFIGTDGSLEICINEGYLMMEIDPDGDADFRPDKFYRLLRTVPEWIDADKSNPFVLDAMWTWDQLIELYERDKVAIDSFADDVPYQVANPSIYSMLNIADTLDAYYGLNNQ